MFKTNAQCYQNISQVLLTSAFILWPTCTRGFGIREKIRCGLRFFGVFLCGFGVFGPLTPVLLIVVEESSGLTAELTRATPVKVGNIWIDLVKTTWSEER